MISVSSDAMEVLALGFNGGRRQMEETELEEGEAFSCNHNNNNTDYDSTIDPDVALSDIDDKLQDVLGHFQKDFEGGVSAENLGAKFGGYGSFLLAYERPPVVLHPKTPLKSQNYTVAPNSSQLEGGQHRRGLPMTCSTSLLGSKSQSVDESVKNKTSKTSIDTNASTSKHASFNKKCLDLPDQKTLKVRIKVGSDNLLTRQNAAIYTGLGLDVSPSSSLEKSPLEAEEMYSELRDYHFDSPASILMVMTSFPANVGLLLSPLSADLIHLTGTQKHLISNNCAPASRLDSENFGMSGMGSNSRKGNMKLLEEMKAKSRKSNKFSVATTSLYDKNTLNCTDALLRREVKMGTFLSEELLSQPVKLPLLPAVTDTEKGDIKASDAFKEFVKDVEKEEKLEPAFSKDLQEDAKPRDSSATKTRKDKNMSYFDDTVVYPKKEGLCNGGKTSKSVIRESDVPNGRKCIDLDRLDQQTGQKDTMVKQELHTWKEQCSGRKKKSKGSKIEVENTVRDCSSAAFETKKSIRPEEYVTKRESQDSKLLNGSRTEGDGRRDIFAETLKSKEENGTATLEIKNSEVVEKTTFDLNNSSMSRFTNKKTDKFSTSKIYPEAIAHVPPHLANMPISSCTAPTTAGVELINESWVGCDKCQKWRLLPVGMDPETLPRKWLCSMLNWLQGMNNCSVSQEETTNAVHAMQQISASVPQNNMHSTLGDIGHRNKDLQNTGLETVTSNEKRKVGLKEISNPAVVESSSTLTNSMKKSIQDSLKIGSTDGLNRSPSVTEVNHRVSNSSDLPIARQKLKQKEKLKIVKRHSDGGESKSSNRKSKRDDGSDCNRESKKIRVGSSLSLKEESMKVAVGSSSSGFPAVLARKDPPSCDRDSQSDEKDRLQVSAKRVGDDVQISLNARSENMVDIGNRDVSKKRKLKESHDTQVCMGQLISTGNVSMNKLSEDEHWKETNANVSECGGKEMGLNKDEAKSDKNCSHSKAQLSGQESTLCERSMNGVDSLTRDMKRSSKISSSHKLKSSLHGSKGSPVQSVSSSPVKTLEQDKHIYRISKLAGKDESHVTGFPAKESLVIYLNGKDNDCSTRSGTLKEKTSLPLTQPGPSESSIIQHMDVNHLANDIPSLGVTNCANGKGDSLGQTIQCSSKPTEQSRDEERKHNKHSHGRSSRSRKSGKGSSSRSKDRDHSTRSHSTNTFQNHAPSCQVSPKDDRNKLQDNFEARSDEIGSRYADKEESAKMLSCGNGKRKSQSKLGVSKGTDSKESTKLNTPQQPDVEHSSKGIQVKKCDEDSVVIVSKKANLLTIPPSGRTQTEMLASESVSGNHKVNEADISASNASQVADAPKVPPQNRRNDNQNGTHLRSLRNPTPNGHKTGDSDGRSPLVKESTSQAATISLKEAKDLKHMADRLKNCGTNLESTGLYFQATLKFLLAASQLESSSAESTNHGDMAHSIQIYSSTAKLCEFCAREYERALDMAAAALAYKLVEVAHMRVVYSSHSSAIRYRHELQTTLQMIPPEASPSSSASDVDNLNHPTTVKAALTKGVCSPQVVGNHVISATNRSYLGRLLTFTQNVNSAMEASRKSRAAFAAASGHSGESLVQEGILSIKRALDFNFQDLKGLLRLVRLAMEAINR